jgi:hypothetical protein
MVCTREKSELEGNSRFENYICASSMDYARSLKQGGKIYSATNPLLDHSSYTELGLRCLTCGEPVFYKRGYVKCPHFAHFPETSFQKQEECRLRQTQWGGNIAEDWRDIILGVEQRLKIFQDYFMSIFIKEIPDFRERTRSLKLLNDSGTLKEIIFEARELFRNNKIELKRKIFDLVSIDNEDSPLQIQILLEIVDYLTTLSSSRLREELLEYSVAVCLETGSSKLRISYDACYELLSLLANINWVFVFTQVTRKNSTLGNKRGFNFDLEEKDYKHEQPRRIKVVKPEEEFVKYLHSRPDFCFSGKIKQDIIKRLGLNHLKYYCFQFTRNNQLELKRKTSFGVYVLVSILCKNIELSEDTNSSSKPVIKLTSDPSSDYYEPLKEDISRFILSKYNNWLKYNNDDRMKKARKIKPERPKLRKRSNS